VIAGTNASSSGGTRLAPADYNGVVRSITEHVRKVVPADGSVLVVSRGDDELLSLGGRPAGHFPQDEAGRYLGYYPKDSESAIAMLEEQRAAGAQYLVFPSTGFWWLDHYGELRQHLQDSCHLVSSHRDCLVYALTDEAAAAANRSSGEAPTESSGHSLTEIVKHLLPAGALAVIVNAGSTDWGGVDGLRVWEFPLGSAGSTYAPVTHLETMRENGAEFLIIPEPAFEWLGQHGALVEHLSSTHLLVTHQEHVCDIYELCASQPHAEPQAETTAEPDPVPAEEAAARKSFFESLFGWTRRPSANGQPY
jgi:hypothetical protein